MSKDFNADQQKASLIPDQPSTAANGQLDKGKSSDGSNIIISYKNTPASDQSSIIEMTAGQPNTDKSKVSLKQNTIMPLEVRVDRNRDQTP